MKTMEIKQGKRCRMPDFTVVFEKTVLCHVSICAGSKQDAHEIVTKGSYPWHREVEDCVVDVRVTHVDHVPEVTHIPTEGTCFCGRPADSQCTRRDCPRPAPRGIRPLTIEQE